MLRRADGAAPARGRALRRLLALGLPALALAGLLPLPAGAGSFNRISSGSGGIARGGDADAPDAVSVSRRTAEPSRDEAGDDDPEAEAKAAAEEAEDEEAPAAGDAADAQEPRGERTLGRACIYGPGGEVLYRPEGRVCGPEPEARAPALPVADRPRSGRCILGAGGRVIHAPAGVACGP